ncbi:unnamed protein product [Moneuplotes crassus]|uniref:Uncharacterized protein n=1 Tax=Euplotes crassus TaxID=5936 RepID=A0AAD2D8K7_EUPCR|nr:unnamed protein product [Moneuplotes crassus]
MKNSSKNLLASEKEVINAIQDFSKKLQKVQINSDLVEHFLTKVGHFAKLPSKCDTKIVDSFLVNLVSILSISSDSSSSVKALELLFTFLKNDPQVYARFKPDRDILQKINLDSFIDSSVSDERNLALNFTSFLLRYHQDLDYNDFSEDEHVVKAIRRAEMYRNWVDIEDLATGYESLHKNSDASSKAFQEILALIDQVKDELSGKIAVNHNQIAEIDEKNQEMSGIFDIVKGLKQDFKGLESDTEHAIVDSNKMLKEMIATFVSDKIKDIEFSINSKIMSRIEALENNSDVHKKHLDNMEERFEILRAKVDKSDSIIKNTHDVVEKLDTKVKRNSGIMNETKKLLIKTIENDPWKQIDFPAHEKSLKKCEEVLAILEEDLEVFKRDTEIKREADVNDSTRAIKDLTKRISEITTESSGKFSDLYRLHSDLRKKSHNIESIADDYSKLLENFKSQIYVIVQNKVNESLGSSKDMKKKMDLIIEETEELWSFNQKFIDEHAVDQERIIEADDLSITRKMEALEWFARYSEFLTPDHAYNGIMTFKNTYLRGPHKDSFINYEHGNDSIILVLDMIEKSLIECKNFANDKSLKKFETRLATKLNILEPLLVNYQNLDLGVNRGAVELLCKTIQTQTVSEDNPNPAFKVYLKYSLRCMTMCLRSKVALEIFLESKQTFNTILDFISIFEDEEVVANAAKILKMMMNDPDKVVMAYKSYNIAKLLVFAISKFIDKSDLVVLELMGALERYTRNQDYVEDLPQDMIEVIVVVARKKFVENPAVQVLRNIAKNPKFEHLVRDYIEEESDE